jgi:hypothetical protein
VSSDSNSAEIRAKNVCYPQSYSFLREGVGPAYGKTGISNNCFISFKFFVNLPPKERLLRSKCYRSFIYNQMIF